MEGMFIYTEEGNVCFGRRVDESTRVVGKCRIRGKVATERCDNENRRTNNASPKVVMSTVASCNTVGCWYLRTYPHANQTKVDQYYSQRHLKLS